MRYERSLIYADEGNRLMITKPIDGEPATVANGGTIGIAAAESRTCSGVACRQYLG